MEETQAVETSTPTAEMVDANTPPKQSILISLTTPLLESVSKPIPGPDPCGRDVSYDDDFLRIKNEIDKMETVGAKIDQEKALEDARQLKSLTARQLRDQDAERAKGTGVESKSAASTPMVADFSIIVDKATVILTQKSKDLRVACYLCLALWRRDGFSGLREGLAAVTILVRTFWEGMYPAKARVVARKNTIDFLTIRLSDSIPNVDIGEEDGEALGDIRSVLDELKTEFETNMPEEPPSLAGLANAVEQCKGRIPKPQLAATPSLVALEPLGQEGATVGEEMAIEVTTVRTQQDAVDLIKRAASFLRGGAAKVPQPYRLVRCMRWDVLLAEPPNEQGKTKVEAPPQQRRAYLSGLQQSGQWEKLVNEAELSFTQSSFHFWLDLQRLAVSAMDALPGYESARGGVLQELGLLVRRLPRLPTLLFSDGTQYANAATQDWIQEVVLRELLPAGSLPAATTTDDDDRELVEHLNEARKLLALGDLVGALSLLSQGAVKGGSPKSVFRRRFHMAGLCMRGNQPTLARPILEELDEEIQRFSLDRWEPAQALEVWRDLHRCYESLASGPPSPAKEPMRENADRIFAKICRLDVTQALALTGALLTTRRAAEGPPKKETRQSDAHPERPSREELKHARSDAQDRATPPPEG
jgi:type VI secretion system protein VasJ